MRFLIRHSYAAVGELLIRPGARGDEMTASAGQATAGDREPRRPSRSPNRERQPHEEDQSGSGPTVLALMRLLVARCSVRYSGRLNATLGESLRLIIFKSDGSVLVHADAGGYKPLNWMTPPTVIEEHEAPDGIQTIVVRKRAGSTEDRLEIRLIEVLSDSEHDMGSPDDHAGLASPARKASPDPRRPST